ncbi:MAG TPA: hypothetical protein VFG30_43510 [Polyangiales bacterium]|nr:hypothetical protein [Polyangiales bacterium]
MTALLDIVNFNADASCLASADWLSAISGGTNSVFCRWLRLYVEQNKKMSLGLTGATVADLAIHNPEALRVIGEHPDVFEIILRPFSHDIALLRSRVGFELNFKLGRKVLEGEFRAVTPFFLPPEFMLTNAQLAQLADFGAQGVFINAERFKPEVKRCLPDTPYLIRGLFGKRLPCIPLQGRITRSYLHALQRYDAEEWNRALERSGPELCATWRDGESFLLLPDGLEREAQWLSTERGIERRFVRDQLASVTFEHEFAPSTIDSYPVHSFSSWVKEFRMYGYLTRLHEIERQLGQLTDDQLLLWLQAINSDVLSAVEKDSPIVRIHPEFGSSELVDWTIQRSARGFEGEEFLSLVEREAGDPSVSDFLATDASPHMRKLRARTKYFKSKGLRA